MQTTSAFEKHRTKQQVTLVSNNVSLMPIAHITLSLNKLSIEKEVSTELTFQESMLPKSKPFSQVKKDLKEFEEFEEDDLLRKSKNRRIWGWVILGVGFLFSIATGAVILFPLFLVSAILLFVRAFKIDEIREKKFPDKTVYSKEKLDKEISKSRGLAKKFWISLLGFILCGIALVFALIIAIGLSIGGGGGAILITLLALSLLAFCAYFLIRIFVNLFSWIKARRGVKKMKSKMVR